jgi:hypothetical protein
MVQAAGAGGLVWLLASEKHGHSHAQKGNMAGGYIENG